jgi:hypothetical protein
MQRKPTNKQRVIFLRNALTTAQVLSTFVHVRPSLKECSEHIGSNISEALRLLNSTDDVILRVCSNFLQAFHRPGRVTSADV